MLLKLKAAVYLAIFSWLFICIGWLIPFWFGRLYEYSLKRQWGLFYVIQCEIGNCTTVAGPIRTTSVDFLGATTTVKLIAIPVLATMSLGLSCLSVIPVLLVCNNCFVARDTTYLYVGIVALQTLTGILNLATIGVSTVANIQFFQLKPMSSIIEIPWSVICYCVGESLLIISIFLFLLMIRQGLKKQRTALTNECDISDEYFPSISRRYPHRYQDDFGTHCTAHHSRSIEHELNHIPAAVVEADVYEPPPDYDMDTPQRKFREAKTYNKSNTYVERLPSRLHHNHGIDLRDSQLKFYKHYTWHPKTVFAIDWNHM